MAFDPKVLHGLSAHRHVPEDAVEGTHCTAPHRIALHRTLAWIDEEMDGLGWQAAFNILPFLVFLALIFFSFVAAFHFCFAATVRF